MQMIKAMSFLEKMHGIDISSLRHTNILQETSFRGIFWALNACKPKDLQSILEDLVITQSSLLKYRAEMWKVMCKAGWIEGIKAMIRMNGGLFALASGQEVTVYFAQDRDNPFLNPAFKAFRLTSTVRACNISCYVSSLFSWHGYRRKDCLR